MNTESIYKVTMVDGPQTSIMPIKARDTDHAMRIAKSMGLGQVVNIVLANWLGTEPAAYSVKRIMYEPKRYDEYGELIQDSDGSWVSGWYTVEDEDGNVYPVKDRD